MNDEIAISAEELDDVERNIYEVQIEIEATVMVLAKSENAACEVVNIIEEEVFEKYGYSNTYANVIEDKDKCKNYWLDDVPYDSRANMTCREILSIQKEIREKREAFLAMDKLQDKFPFYDDENQ